MDKRICFWILAGDDFNGIIAIGREGLAEYLKGLSYADRQGMQVTPFELGQLSDVLAATDARILILEAIALSS